MKYLAHRPLLVVCLILTLVASAGTITQFAKTTLKAPTSRSDVKSDAASSSPQTKNAGDKAAQQARVNKNYGQLPLSFEANRGQTDAQVKFLARNSSYNLFLTADEAVLTLQHRTHQTKKDKTGRVVKEDSSRKVSGEARQSVLRMRVLGANPEARVEGVEPLAARSNYLIGRDPQRWQTDVPHYGKIRYESIYPGVNLIYYGNQKQLEYDFHVAPGAKPETIALGFKGADKIRLDKNGDLVLRTAGGDVRQLKPVAYQEIDGQRRSIACRYVLRGGDRISFEVGAYDAGAPLVIDPIMNYSTYLGGNNQDEASGVAVDGQGNTYVVGSTVSTNFPVTPGAFQTQLAGTVSATYDAFVTKLNPEGTAIIYSTFIGGRYGGDHGTSIVVSATGEAHIAGETNSQDFPMYGGAYQAMLRGSQDAFIAKLNPVGSYLTYSTFLGGTNAEYNPILALNPYGDLFIAGRTTSLNFPLFGPGFQKFPGGTSANCAAGPCSDGFLVQLRMIPGSRPVFSTFLGGSGDDFIDGIDLRENNDDSIYVAGRTNSSNFPTTPTTFKNTKSGDAMSYDAFVTRFYRTGDRLIYSTYLGGAEDDYANDITVDLQGTAFVTGTTASPGFPVTPNAFQQSLAGSGSHRYDAFLTLLRDDGRHLHYSTFIGGSFDDVGTAVNLYGPEVYIAGQTASHDLRVSDDALQPNHGGGAYDGFLMRMMPNSPWFTYLTYIGGADYDQVKDIALSFVGSAPIVYLVGSTWSSDFYVTPNAIQPAKGSEYEGDGFVARVHMGQQGLTVKGRVTNEFGNGLVDVEVTFSGSVNRTVRTDEDGYYRLGGILPGSNLTLTAARDGFVFYPSNVPLNNVTNNATVDFSGTAPLIIKGRITTSTGGGVSVPVMLNGMMNAYTQSDAHGYYRFSQVPSGGSYTVRPLLTDPYSAYEPEFQHVVNIEGDQILHFQMLPPPKISGHIKDEGSGFPREYIHVRLLNEQGMEVQQTFTNRDGYYQFTQLPRFQTFTVTPVINYPAWTFAPESQTLTNIRGEVTADFTSLPPFIVTGLIRDAYGNPMSGVTVTLSGDIQRTLQTDATGRYSCYEVPRGATYTITPSINQPLWTFAPASHTVTNAQTDETEDFTALPPINIDGQVKDEYGNAMSGVVMTLSGDASATTQTDFYGWYAFPALPRGGNYTVTPTKPDTFWTFAPASQSVTDTREFQRLNFNGLPPLRIEGQIKDEFGNVVQGADVTLAGAVNRTTQTDANGWYYFPMIQRGGAYTVTAAHELYNFTPPSHQVPGLNEVQLLPFSAVFKRYSIGGRIADAGGAGVAGVSLQIDGGHAATTQTDADGNYSFAGLIAARNYFITPTRAGWSFAPQTYAKPDLRADHVANFEAARLTYSINGRALDAGGSPIAGAQLNLTGAHTATTQTDADGNYSFAGLASEGTYTVAASHVNFNFTPPAQTFDNLLSNQTAEFNGTRINYAINGHVADGAGASMAGVTITLGGAQSATTSTDAGGNYTFANLASGFGYNVAASGVHYAFSPPVQTIDNLGANSSADFTGTLLRHNINGRVADSNGNAISGADVNLSGSQTATVKTDANGNYIFASLPAGGNYNVAVFHGWYAFNPSAQAFNNLGNDRTANFNGELLDFTLGGRIAEAGTGIAGVTVSLNGSQTATAQTDANGNYSFSVPAGGSYTVAPSHPYFVFAPTGAAFNALSMHQTANFAATRLGYQVSGYARDACGRAIAAVTMSLTLAGGTTAAAQTDANGFYAFPGVQAGYSYTLAATKTGYTFTPPSVAFANLNANQLSNFTGKPATTTTQLAALADAYVRGGTTANFGTATQLITRLASSASNTHETFLTFDVGQRCTVTSVKLRLYGKLSGGSNLSVAAYSVANTTWTETGINWNNKPPAGSLLTTKTIPNTTNAWHEWDITTYVRNEINAGRTRISLVLKNPSVTSYQATFNARQATTNQPQLVITTP